MYGFDCFMFEGFVEFVVEVFDVDFDDVGIVVEVVVLDVFDEGMF